MEKSKKKVLVKNDILKYFLLALIAYFVCLAVGLG